MRTVHLILAGFGNVGRAFARLIQEKNEFCQERYGLDICLEGILKRKGGIVSVPRLDLAFLQRNPSAALEQHPQWKTGLEFSEVLRDFFRGSIGVFVDCTPSNIRTGEPGLTYVHQALEQGWHVVAAAKGALVRDFKNISARAKSKGLALKFSGATAAALPALDVGLVSLAGVEILKIEGILNGTTNFILTRMGEGCSYADALREAQVKGIAEPDPSMDVEGWDTACKLLLIANAVAGADLELEDIHVEGISGLSYEFIRRAKDASQAVKLLGKVDRREDGYHAEVVLSCLEKSHPLFSVDGANKAISFFTDTMGAITISGGKSDPRGAAAALLKDIINIYRAA